MNAMPISQRTVKLAAIIGEHEEEILADWIKEMNATQTPALAKKTLGPPVRPRDAWFPPARTRL